MASERADIAVVGAGIVGLATARALLIAHPGLRLVVVDKETRVAAHQTGHNSGVLHAGVYYAPGSRKAAMCRAGKAQLEEFARQHGIPFEHSGKLIVAVDEAERPRLADLLKRAQANGVPGAELLDRERIREIEPHVAGVAALWSPETGVIDYRLVAATLADEIREAGGTILLEREVTAIREMADERVLETTGGPIAARDVIVCGGLQADRLAAMTGTRGPRIVPFRGDYYVLRPEAARLVRGLIYPVPDPRFPFLGAHFTRRIDGEVWAGPNAVLAFAREGYRRRDVDPIELVRILGNRGFLRLASRNLSAGVGEMWRDYSKRAFLGALQRHIPELTEADLLPGPSGVRAQAIDIGGRMVDDFAIGGSAHVLHVQNAPSPAATASLAIGAWLADAARDSFGLS
ncbi:MAG TPA: L-2-hydroxyglutarate oxidase [Candidatus Limnocylindrales bacterium]